MSSRGLCGDNLAASAYDPYFYPPENPDCPHCRRELCDHWEEFEFCPFCGEELDWERGL